MTETVTVYEITHAGRSMDEAQIEIKIILEKSSLSILNKIIVLDLMAFEYKLKALK